MHTVTSFHGSDVPPEQLTALMADYVALDQARISRGLFVTRFGVLAFVLGMIGFGFHWLPSFASWFSVALCGVRVRRFAFRIRSRSRRAASRQAGGG